jgi:hypothetical protein
MKTKSQGPSCDYCLMILDLEQMMPARKNSNKINNYAYQIWVQYIGVHVCNDNYTINCMWLKNFASRGSSEISSCLFKVLTEPQVIINKSNSNCFVD